MTPAPATAPTRVERDALGERVYLLLRERILDRRLHAGQTLSDLRLSEELGVSRTPVREALQRLAQDGILRLERNRGFYVASFSPRDVAEIYDLRATLEVMALAVAAPRLTTATPERAIAELDRVDELRATTDEDWVEAALAFLEIDRWFHRRIVELAGNSRLEAIDKGLWALIAVLAGRVVPAGPVRGRPRPPSPGHRRPARRRPGQGRRGAPPAHPRDQAVRPGLLPGSRGERPPRTAGTPTKAEEIGHTQLHI